jgi:anti-sigma factor ChrR (cupin superfamily)
MTRPPNDRRPMEPATTGHDGDRERAAELADLYAVGALMPEEIAEFEARVASGDTVYVQELARVRPVLEAMCASARPIEPPARLRDAVMSRVTGGEQSRAHDYDHDHEDDEHVGGQETEPYVLRFGELRFRPTGIPGVTAHTLLADKKNNRRTLILKMEPGSALPDHTHSGMEEVLVLEGDLSIAGRLLQARDYIRVAEGVRHGQPVSPSGCIALVFSTYGSLSPRTKLGMAWWSAKEWIRRGLRRGA